MRAYDDNDGQGLDPRRAATSAAGTATVTDSDAVTPVDAAVTEAYERFSDGLARERLLLERVVFKLTQLHQMLLAGDGRFLAWASDELEGALDDVGQAELERSLHVLTLAEAIGADPEALPLSVIVASAPQPWAAIIADHQSAMTAMQAEAARLCVENRRSAENGHRVVSEALDRSQGLEPAGRPATRAAGPWSTEATDSRVERRL